MSILVAFTHTPNSAVEHSPLHHICKGQLHLMQQAVWPREVVVKHYCLACARPVFSPQHTNKCIWSKEEGLFSKGITFHFVDCEEKATGSMSLEGGA